MADIPMAPDQAPSPSRIRVLFCFNALPPFFDLDDAGRKALFDRVVAAYADLSGRFGATVLGTLDDERLLVGPTFGWPFTSYILAEVPDHAAAASICDILRQTAFGSDRLWRYIRVEARTGRPLFFGNA